MDLKGISIATIAGAVTLFGIGFLIYGILGGGEMIYDGPGAGSMKAEFSMLPLFLTELFSALLISIVYSNWAGIKTFATGAKNGAIIGTLLALIVTTDTMAGTEFITWGGVAFYTITHAIRTAIAGGVIGLVLGKFGEK